MLGIGLGIAEELRKGGVALVVTGFGDAAEVERTRQRLADLIPGDDRVHYVPADLGKVVLLRWPRGCSMIDREQVTDEADVVVVSGLVVIRPRTWSI